MSGYRGEAEHFSDIDTFPFLSIETDGSPFPQLIEANLEAFLLQAGRVHSRILEVKDIQKTGKPKNLPLWIFDIVMGNGKSVTSKPR